MWVPVGTQGCAQGLEAGAGAGPAFLGSGLVITVSAEAWKRTPGRTSVLLRCQDIGSEGQGGQQEQDTAAGYACRELSLDQA